MAEQRQQFVTLTPQLVIGAVPIRISSADLFVRGLIVESADGNTGKIFLSDSEANATTLNRHTLFIAGDAVGWDSTPWGNLDAQVNLREIWVHGTVPGDRVVVSYLEITEALI